MASIVEKLLEVDGSPSNIINFQIIFTDNSRIFFIVSYVFVLPTNGNYLNKAHSQSSLLCTF